MDNGKQISLENARIVILQQRGLHAVLVDGEDLKAFSRCPALQDWLLQGPRNKSGDADVKQRRNGLPHGPNQAYRACLITQIHVNHRVADSKSSMSAKAYLRLRFFDQVGVVDFLRCNQIHHRLVRPPIYGNQGPGLHSIQDAQASPILSSQVLGIVREELQQSHRDLVSVQRNDMRRGVAKPISCSSLGGILEE